MIAKSSLLLCWDLHHVDYAEETFDVDSRTARSSTYDAVPIIWAKRAMDSADLTNSFRTARFSD